MGSSIFCSARAIYVERWVDVVREASLRTAHPPPPLYVCKGRKNATLCYLLGGELDVTGSQRVTDSFIFTTNGWES